MVLSISFWFLADFCSGSTLCLLGRNGTFYKALIQAALGPVHNMIWQCQRRVRLGRTVRFLYVEGMGRQAGLSDSFMSAPRVHSGSLVSWRNPGWWWMASLPTQGLECSGLSLKRRPCCWCFQRKNVFCLLCLPLSPSKLK